MSKKRKEEKNMEAINKPREAMMIAKGMTRSFVELLVSQRCSADYWDECANTKKSVSSSTMDELKKMCTEEEE